jgi:hypothetical protein
MDQECRIFAGAVGRGLRYRLAMTSKGEALRACARGAIAIR